MVTFVLLSLGFVTIGIIINIILPPPLPSLINGFHFLILWKVGMRQAGKKTGREEPSILLAGQVFLLSGWREDGG